jgi:hypothetical protein
MTCVPLTASHGEELLTWFLADFHAKTSALRAKEPVLQESEADCGPKWRGSFARYDHATHSLKTVQCSFLEDSTESCVTLPRWGSMRSGELSVLEMSVRHTLESGYGLLDSTPTKVMPVENSLPADRIKILNSGRPRKISKKGTDGSLNWAQLMLHKGFLPTPMLCEYFMGWPIGATDLRPLEMDRFHEWQQQHGIS